MARKRQNLSSVKSAKFYLIFFLLCIPITVGSEITGSFVVDDFPPTVTSVTFSRSPEVTLDVLSFSQTPLYIAVKVDDPNGDQDISAVAVEIQENTVQLFFEDGIWKGNYSFPFPSGSYDVLILVDHSLGKDRFTSVFNVRDTEFVTAGVILDILSQNTVINYLISLWKQIFLN